MQRKIQHQAAAFSMEKAARTPDENTHLNANAPRQLSAIDIRDVKSSMKLTKLIEEKLDFGLRNVAWMSSVQRGGIARRRAVIQVR
jgi:hypothetical protein